MTQVYVHNGQNVAEGERDYVLFQGRTFVKTGTLETSLDNPDMMYIKFRLRETKEVVDAPPPPPAPVTISLSYEVPSP